MMKIILSIENAKGRNSFFIGDDGKVYPKEEAIALARVGQIDDIRVATRAGISYLRTNRRRNTRFTLQEITVADTLLQRASTRTSDIVSQPAFQQYWNQYQIYLENEAKNGAARIAVDGYNFSTDAHIRERIAPLKEDIFDAAGRFKIDPYLLCGILIDEVVRLAPFEDIMDKVLLDVFNWNSSIGIGQVTLDTARDLVKNGYFNPAPDNPKLSPSSVGSISKKDLYPFIAESKNNILFAAARIRNLKDAWKSAVNIDLSSEIIATLYSLGYVKPHVGSKANARGVQIVNEFMPFAREILDTI